MQVKPVIPARDSKLKDIVDKLEQIGHSMRHQMTLYFSLSSFNLAFLYSEVVILFFLHNNAKNDILKITKATSHVHFAQLFHRILKL